MDRETDALLVLALTFEGAVLVYDERMRGEVAARIAQARDRFLKGETDLEAWWDAGDLIDRYVIATRKEGSLVFPRRIHVARLVGDHLFYDGICSRRFDGVEQAMEVARGLIRAAVDIKNEEEVRVEYTGLTLAEYEDLTPPV